MYEQSQMLDLLADERIVLSTAYAAVVLVLRWLIMRMIRGRTEVLSEARRGWITCTKNAAIGLLLVGLALIWLPELGNFVLSITAIVVALVIVTKELILRLSGSAYRAGANVFNVGDWVQIGPHFREVIDYDMASTALQHVYPDPYVHDGTSITLPNSLLLSQPVVNRNFLNRYLFNTVEWVIEPDAPLPEVIPIARDLIESESADFFELALRYFLMIRKRTGTDIPDPHPRFQLGTSDIAKPKLTVTFFCPRERAV